MYLMSPASCCNEVPSLETRPPSRIDDSPNVLAIIFRTPFKPSKSVSPHPHALSSIFPPATTVVGETLFLLFSVLYAICEAPTPRFPFKKQNKNAKEKNGSLSSLPFPTLRALSDPISAHHLSSSSFYPTPLYSSSVI